jgi:GT2 family glycosyltransferase
MNPANRNSPHGNTVEPSDDVYVVITDFNGFAQTRRCLEALSLSIFGNPKVIVVDHGTTTETREGLAREFPWAMRIEAPSELWWAGAINCGVQLAVSLEAKQIVLLNNDCYVHADTIFQLMWLAKTKPDAIISSVQRDLASGAIESISLDYNFLLGFPSRPGALSVSAAQLAEGLLSTRLIGGGRGVVIPVDVFKKIGFFDAAVFPHYWADHDFYLRAQRSGFRLYVGLHAVVDIDNTRTTIAQDFKKMNFSEFLESLHSIRSHRSIKYVTPLFKRYYPFRPLHLIGVYLYVARYILLYFLSRRPVSLAR